MVGGFFIGGFGIDYDKSFVFVAVFAEIVGDVGIFGLVV